MTKTIPDYFTGKTIDLLFQGVSCTRDPLIVVSVDFGGAKEVMLETSVSEVLGYMEKPRLKNMVAASLFLKKLGIVKDDIIANKRKGKLR